MKMWDVICLTQTMGILIAMIMIEMCVSRDKIFLDEEDAKDTTCNMTTIRDEVILRKPTKEEINQITRNMVA